MKFPQLAFKIAQQLIQQKLQRPGPQYSEPADINTAGQTYQGNALDLVAHKNVPTATEPSTKAVARGPLA